MQLSNLLRPRRTWLVSVLFVLAHLIAAPGVDAAPCGGNGERACCVCEPGAACDPGLVEVAGCSGNCDCGGGFPCNLADSSGTCRAIAPCGGQDQRACCFLEASFGACRDGLTEVSGCSGNCLCSSGVASSSGTCRLVVSPCGGDGERACCLFEASFGACEGDLTEVPGCTGDCLCSGGLASSSGTCISTTACGGLGERACCVGEGAACDAGLTEVPGCEGNCFCSGGVLGSSSSGTCIQTTACGGLDQRACCVGETANGGNGGGCDGDLLEVPGCDGDCYCSGGILGSQSSGTCRPQTAAAPCGGEGERACCGATFEGANCESGLIEVAGCSGNCICGGFNPLNLFASGTCHRFAPCGAEGQRACCAAERIPSCDAGLIEVLGCSGDCFCGGSLTGIVDDDALGTSAGTCVRSSPGSSMAEPAVGFTPPASEPVCSQRGYADLHMHLFADIAHGGGVLAATPCPRNDSTYCLESFADAGPMTPGACGTSYCDDGLGASQALNACYGTDLDLVKKDGSALASPNCPSWLGDCGAKLFHGDHTVLEDAVGSELGTLDGSGFAHLGAPVFHGWPQWTSTTHQQSYYKWLERAWRGGMRLIVQMAVNNTALCLTNRQLVGVDCSDTMAFIDQQLQAAYDFEDFIDRRVGGGVDADEGWFRIVRTPLEAREVIAAGKMAVVLGIEVDHLFNCEFPSSQCEVVDNKIVSCAIVENNDACRDPNDPSKASADWVREQVDFYHEVWGVQHVFPIHNFDNSFGGAATWQSAIEVGNRFVEGHWYYTRDCSSEGFSFKLGEDGTFLQALASLFGFGVLTTVPFHPEVASCNQFGLFPLGETLVDEMMEKGMIIDVDHMSTRALDDTIARAQAFRPAGYPLAISHALFRDLHTPETRHERMRTAGQLAQIQAMGGMAGVMLKDDVLDRGTRGQRKTLDHAPSGVTDDCRHSSKTFAQAYAYAVDQLGARAGMGSDFNGVAGHFGPRFGSRACGGEPVERSAQLRAKNRLEYPFTLDEFGSFDRQVSGKKIFDYNVDGMAHVGLLPDFVADLSAIGLSNAQLDPLLRSAEAYIQMWELARGDEVLDGCTCSGEGETFSCSEPSDSDQDGWVDAADNCSSEPNADQTDTDGDDIGNRCDCDFDQDGVCGIADFSLFLADFVTGEDGGAGTDMDASGDVAIGDFSWFLQGFTVGTPGPSGLVP